MTSAPVGSAPALDTGAAGHAAGEGRFQLVDSLRALAALAIVGFHGVGFIAAEGAPSWLVTYAARLDVGVSIFFVISGMLLYRPFVTAQLTGTPLPRLRAYAWRRFLRIAPGYWVALSFLLLWLGERRVLHGESALAFYGFAQVYDPDTALHGMTQAWTLCVEVAFYAGLPFFALAVAALPLRSRSARLGGQLAAVLALMASGVGWNLWVAARMDPAGMGALPWILSLPAYLDHFALGMLLAVATAAMAGPAARLGRLAGPAWLVAAFAFWAVATQVGAEGFGTPATGGEYLARHGLYALIGVALVAPAAIGASRGGLVRRLLRTRILVALGAISYGIYLYHLGVMAQVFSRRDPFLPGVPSGARLALAVGAGLALAAVSWLAVERPVLRLKRLVSSKA